MPPKLIFATRPSALARWQTNYVIQKLKSERPDLTCEEVVITTKGDRILDKPLPEIGGKGLFTFELEGALREGTVDAAVHSLKDLPIEDAPGLKVAVIPERADARDVLVCPSRHKLNELQSGNVIGTSSIRRGAQLLSCRPDLLTSPIRGNVDTRIRKVSEGQYDGVILAAAGLIRLGLSRHITQYLPLELMLPAPGQGALAVQCREDDEETLRLLDSIDHTPTRTAVTAERAFLAGLGGGCSLPVGAFAEAGNDLIDLRALAAAPDGSRVIRVSGSGSHPGELGGRLAEEALAQGAGELISLEPPVG